MTTVDTKDWFQSWVKGLKIAGIALALAIAATMTIVMSVYPTDDSSISGNIMAMSFGLATTVMLVIVASMIFTPSNLSARWKDGFPDSAKRLSLRVMIIALVTAAGATAMSLFAQIAQHNGDAQTASLLALGAMFIGLLFTFVMVFIVAGIMVSVARSERL